MKKFLFLISILFSLSLNAQINTTVAKDGSGNYTTLQAAIDAAPTNSVTPYVIYIKNGKYYEKINIPSNKPNLQIIGESVTKVMVYYDDYAGKPLTGGGTLGTQNSASVTINANDFVSVNVTYANTFNYDSAVAAGVTGSQAVAVVINADRSAFKNCRFIGMQDTLYTKGSGTPRHYFYKCYVDGIIDFIFGSSIAIFDSCVIYPKSRTGTSSSYITAANTTTAQAYGYFFKDCKIPANTGTTSYYLGRPWGNATAGITAENKTVYSNTKMSNSINPLGWSTWDAGTNTSVITYAEYKSKKFDGTLVDTTNRVAWSKQFKNTDTVGYNILNMFSGWNPCSVRTDFCNSPTTEIAVSNFKGIKSGANANFSWNISWALTGITYELYKSTNNKLSYSLLSSITATNDTAINFSGTDAVPPAGSIYYYCVKASLSGYNTTYTDTIAISSTPTINKSTSALTNFLQGSTAPSSSQNYYVSGVNLLNAITITAPTNFQISIDNTNWNTNPITLTQTSGTVNNTLIYVRLNAASAGNYSGKIILQTIGNSITYSDTVSVSGVTQSTPLLNFDIIQQWKLISDNTDDAATRVVGLDATTPTFNKLYVSNGTTVPAIAAYSTQFGQAFGATANGDGSWGTSSGGPGSNLNRIFYEQFTVKPSTGYSVRVDSILLSSAFYNTSSGIKLAVVYSKTNFTTDSADVTGGRDASGATLTGTANGGFTTPILLPNQTSGPTTQYGLALNAGNGVNIGAGETLTIRLYFSCGSSSPGRYGMLKTVQVKGLTPNNLPVKIKNYEVKLNNEKQVLNEWTTLTETNTSHFNVQRSFDGRSFENIGKVEAVGASSYSFKDDNLSNNLSSKIYYRLEVVDFDGSKNYSEIKVISLSKDKSTFSFYPNPAKDFIVVEGKNIEQINIIDRFGRVLKQIKNNAEQQIINTSLLAKGLYIFQVITSKKEIITSKFLVE